MSAARVYRSSATQILGSIKSIKLQHHPYASLLNQMQYFHTRIHVILAIALYALFYGDGLLEFFLFLPNLIYKNQLKFAHYIQFLAY